MLRASLLRTTASVCATAKHRAKTLSLSSPLRPCVRSVRSLCAESTAYQLGALAIASSLALRETRCEALSLSLSAEPQQHTVCRATESDPECPSLSQWSLESLWRSLCASLDLLSRWLFLLCAYSPAIASAPLLLLSPRWQDRWWATLRESIVRSGPCFIKFAQWISTRPDLFPALLCAQFAELQSTTSLSVPAWEEIEPVLVAHYGRDWERRLRIERDAAGRPVVVGGGAIAQVLKGRVRVSRRDTEGVDSAVESTGAGAEEEVEVAVKITHPGVKRVIERDVTLMTSLSAWLEYFFPSLRQVSMRDSVEVFAQLMLQQVDMQFEAQNLRRLIANFDGNADCDSDGESERASEKKSFFSRSSKRYNVSFPRPYMRLSNEDVLVEEFEPGELMRDHMRHCSAENKKRIAEIGMDAVFKMVFLDNFVHADLHPGNIILRDPDTLELSMIDAGLVVSLESNDRVNLVELFQAVVRNDGYAVGQLMIRRSRNLATVVDEEGFCLAIQEIVDKVHRNGLALGKIGVSEILQKVFLLCYQHQVKLETRFASVMVAMGVVEGLGRQLDPDIDILKRLAPFVMRAALMGRA